jgi:hypothetical protein
MGQSVLKKPQQKGEQENKAHIKRLPEGKKKKPTE